jgi:hypothetical protein
MTDNEVAFMTAASEASDAQGGSAFVGDVSAILAKLNQKGLTEKQVWQCQLSLKRARSGAGRQPPSPVDVLNDPRSR